MILTLSSESSAESHRFLPAADMDEGADAWRFDDTKLDDLEDFLRQENTP